MCIYCRQGKPYSYTDPRYHDLEDKDGTLAFCTNKMSGWIRHHRYDRRMKWGNEDNRDAWIDCETGDIVWTPIGVMPEGEPVPEDQRLRAIGAPELPAME